MKRKSDKILQKAIDALPIRSRFIDHDDRIKKLEEQMNDMTVGYQQLAESIKQNGGILPPPPHLQKRVAGAVKASFLQSGKEAVENLNSILAPASKNISSFGTVLDFGCGCGRVVLALSELKVPSQQIHGTDIDKEAITWCQDNYSKLGEFNVNGVLPPMRYPTGYFDFIFSISIFTHLPEDMQFAWLAELKRITKPGGWLVLSTHGENHFSAIPEGNRSTMNSKGFFYYTDMVTDGLPEFYQTAFHTHDYIRREWSKYFKVVDIQERAVQSHQDAVLCQNS